MYEDTAGESCTTSRMVELDSHNFEARSCSWRRWDIADGHRAHEHVLLARDFHVLCHGLDRQPVRYSAHAGPRGRQELDGPLGEAEEEEGMKTPGNS